MYSNENNQLASVFKQLVTVSWIRSLLLLAPIWIDYGNLSTTLTWEKLLKLQNCFEITMTSIHIHYNFLEIWTVLIGIYVLRYKIEFSVWTDVELITFMYFRLFSILLVRSCVSNVPIFVTVLFKSWAFSHPWLRSCHCQQLIPLSL